MAEKVLKDFKTVNRVFKVGDEVGPDDIQGYVSFEQWQERWFVSGAVPRTATPAVSLVIQDAPHEDIFH